MIPSITLTDLNAIDMDYLEDCILTLKDESPDQKYVINILESIMQLAIGNVAEVDVTRKEEVSMFMSLKEVGYDVHRIFDGDDDWHKFKFECMKYIPTQEEAPNRKEGRLRKHGVPAPAVPSRSYRPVSGYEHNAAKAQTMVLSEIHRELQDIRTLLVRILKKGEEK